LPQAEDVLEDDNNSVILTAWLSNVDLHKKGLFVSSHPYKKIAKRTLQVIDSGGYPYTSHLARGL
jgi:hypothetical protein